MTHGPVPSPGRAVDAPLPTGDRLASAYLLGIADDAMVYAQRLGEWLTNAPQIEEDMALANVSLDLLGQARGLYPHIGELDGSFRSEDDFAMLRDEREWRNVHLVEQERRDFGFEMARLLWFSAYQVELYAAAAGSTDETFRAVAEKATKEVAYHHDHAHQWVVRLGDGTDESHERMQAALEAVLPYLAELFDDDPVSSAAAEAGVGVLPSSLHDAVVARVAAVVEEATLTLPDDSRWRSRGGRQGVHSAPMGYLLAEMQHLARSHPGATW
jgi:ring-1,2-phenylacetyl-CoA epoxidase subunit PaaC